MTVTAQTIAAALQAKAVGERRWKARCPAHEDKNPSFWISESATGKVLVKCWAGCTQEAVIAALQARRLWHEHPDAPPPLRPRGIEALAVPPAPLQQILELERLLDDATYLEEDAAYIVVGQILEDAARMTYHVTARVSAVLMEKGGGCARYTERWMNERFPDALFEPRQ